MIDWSKLTKKDSKKIDKIVDRVMGATEIEDKSSLVMDIQAGHIAIPLDLDKLLNAPAFDFAHDIGGIRQNLNRTTGKIENCFVPRCALPEEVEEVEEVEEIDPAMVKKVAKI